MAAHGGMIGPSGALGLKVSPRVQQAPLAWRLRNARHRYRGAWRARLAEAVSRITGCPVAIGRLYVRVLHADGTVTDYGLVSERVVTTAGVGYIVDAFQNSVELEDQKYHGFGTGTTAENAADTDIETEFTTQYASDNVRPTGTTTEGATANIYRTVATFTPDSGGTLAVTEHGVLSSATVGAGVLLDRTVFSAVNVVAASDSLQATYELTLTAGS